MSKWCPRLINDLENDSKRLIKDVNIANPTDFVKFFTKVKQSVYMRICHIRMYTYTFQF